MDTREYDAMINGSVDRSKEVIGLPAEMGLFQHLILKDDRIDAETKGFGKMLIPFAFEETLCRDVGAGLIPPSLHLWSHSGGCARPTGQQASVRGSSDG